MHTTESRRVSTALSALAIAAAALLPAFAHALPAGEIGNSVDQTLTGSSKTRADRKAETMQARQKGQLKTPGEALYLDNLFSQRNAVKDSTKTRAERKAETLQAAKDHRLTPAGEATATN